MVIVEKVHIFCNLNTSLEICVLFKVEKVLNLSKTT